MNETSLQLPHDILLPEPVSAVWPLAIGWWFLLVFVCIVLLIIAVYTWRFYRNRAPLRAALLELNAVQKIHNTAEMLSACSLLLKRVAILRYGRTHVAALHGENWLAFLDRSSGSQSFTTGAGLTLLTRYAPQASTDREALIQLCEQWLRAQWPHPFSRRKKGPLAAVATERNQHV